jgi:alkylated DNA repair protein alkB family protein 4
VHRNLQDYGPRVNFKARKVRMDRFLGMPDYADLILHRIEQIPALGGKYQPFELCNLEYEATRNSGIEMHQDDTWIWGNRLIRHSTISLPIPLFQCQLAQRVGDDSRAG